MKNTPDHQSVVGTSLGSTSRLETSVPITEDQIISVRLDRLEVDVNKLVDVPIFQPLAITQIESMLGEVDLLAPAVEHAAFRSRYLKLCAVLAEAAQHFGRTEMARALLLGAKQVVEELPSPELLFDKAPTKEEVRFAVAFAFVVHYESGASEAAIALLKKCVGLIHAIATDEDPCHGTIAHAFLHRAIVFRGMGQEALAVDDFHGALNSYAMKARRHREMHDGEEGKEQQGFHWLRHRGVQVLIDLGWTYYRHGRLDRARDCVSSAELLQGAALLDVDQMTYAHTSVLRAAIQRSTIDDSSTTELRASLPALSIAENTYQTFGHVHWLLRCWYEQAMTHKHLPGGMEDARRLFYRAIQVPPDASAADRRLACYATAQLSLIASTRNDAIDLATTALSQAGRIKARLCMVDALYARAEAHLRSPADPAKARADLANAEEMVPLKSGGNRRLQARWELLQALAYVNDGDEEKAEEYLQRARIAVQAIKYAGLNRLMENVQQQRDAVYKRTDFTLKAGREHNYEHYTQLLRRWLLVQARTHHHRQTDVAKAINITRTTLYKWDAEFESMKVRDARGSKRNWRRAKKRY